MIYRKVCQTTAKYMQVCRSIGRRKMQASKVIEFDKVKLMAGELPESHAQYGLPSLDDDIERVKERKESQPGMRLIEMLEKVDEKQCRGCGAMFQFEDQRKEGYIDLNRLKTASHNATVSEVLDKLAGGMSSLDTQTAGDMYEQPSNTNSDTDRRMYTLQDYENDPLLLDSINEIEEIFEGSFMPKDICDRCVMLNSGRYKEMRDIEVNIESRPLPN